MDDSDEDPSTIPHRQPPRESKLAIIDASLHYPPLGLEAWHPSHPLVSGRSSRASTDNEELESLGEVLRQRRLSRHSGLINHVSPSDTYAGIKAIKLAIQEHELPVKMAYKQLDELAANAERVRASIEKNRSLLLLQVKRNNSRYIRAAFTAWKLHVDKKIGQKTMLNHAKIRITHGLVLRTFKSWCFYLLRSRRYRKFLSSVQKIVYRHLLQQLWKSWLGFVRQRVQKDENRRKEKRILKNTSHKIKEGLERRAEVIMHRKRLEKLFFAFIEGCQVVKMKRFYLKDLYQIMSKKTLSRIFNTWNCLRKVHSFYERAVQKFIKRRLGVCFRAWSNKDFFLEICWRKIQRKRLALIFTVWAHKTGRKRCLNSRIRRKHLLWYFNAFKQGCQQARWSQCFQQKLSKKIIMCKLKVAFQAWLNFMQDFIHHNKMLIRGASSFNTIVRALKIDALQRGVHSEFLCALDRLAMDKVSVFPDGEIRVKTFCNFEKGKWVPKDISSCVPDLCASCNASNLFNKGSSSRTTVKKI